uniref:Transposase MuDR plant domain-containing protein n=1 Tax=Ananas comosus var. bracteatus TaxID=296719 RepID=A0A6V7QMJ5_ANACO|nr:unnamed protein product [Ananas comosus var. bracteatus]
MALTLPRKGHVSAMRAGLGPVMKNTIDIDDVNRSDDECVIESDEEDQRRIDADSSDDDESFVLHSLDPDHDGSLNALACAIRDKGVVWIENSNVNNDDVPDPVEFDEFEDQRQRFLLGDELIHQSVVDAYTEQNIDQGPPSDESWANRTFSDKSFLVNALEAWHIAHNVQLKIVKSNTTRYTVTYWTFANCEGRFLQAGTPELAYATYVRSCGIEKPTGSSGTDTFQE